MASLDYIRRRLKALPDDELLRHAAAAILAEFDARRRRDGEPDPLLALESKECWYESGRRGRPGLYDAALERARAELAERRREDRAAWESAGRAKADAPRVE